MNEPLTPTYRFDALIDGRMVRKTNARELAKMARRYGYHQKGDDIYVFCPLCRSRVHAYFGAHATKSLNATLDTAVVEHITFGECE